MLVSGPDRANYKNSPIALTPIKFKSLLRIFDYLVLQFLLPLQKSLAS